jgi:hypothetical protein
MGEPAPRATPEGDEATLSPPPDFLQTAVAVARRLNIGHDEPVVLAEGMSLIVLLPPRPIVARVTRVAHHVRPVEEVAGTVGLARALAGLVVQPAETVDPGPHLADGRYVTFWTHVDPVPAAPAEAGASLRAFHEAARRYDGRLRSFDPRPEAFRIARLVGGDAGAALQAVAARISVPDLPPQPVHGDAHLGNALAGGRWLDLEEACFGPREWDVACLRHRSFFFGEIPRETGEALAAYGAFDEGAAAALDPLVVLWTAAWGAMAAVLGEPIGPRTHRRLAWLQERYAP